MPSPAPPLHARGVSADAIMSAMTRDKKGVDGRIRFVLPVTVGEVRHGINVSMPVIRDVVATCLAPPTAAELRK